MTGVVPVTADVLAQHPLPDHGDESSKAERGGVLVVGGTAETPGAALLAGLAALRAGAGMLQVATAASAASALAVAVPEARVIGIEGERPEAFDAAAEQLDTDLAKVAAVLVGPGTFTPDTTRRLVVRAVAVLADTEGVLVLDAGSLPLLAEDPALLAPLGGRAVVTPNPSEAARMLDPDAPHDAEVDAEACLAEAVERFGCVVTVRGGESWTARPGSPADLDRAGVVGLATSGSGDVLAGLVAGLAARGADPLAPSCGRPRCTAGPASGARSAPGPSASWPGSSSTEVGPALVELSS